MSERPKGELVIQTIAMPKDTNANGDIFGGWVTGLGQWNSCGENCSGARGHSGDGRNVIFGASESGGHGQLLCAGGENRADFDDDSSRGLGDASYDW
jgi:hypothetical protein